MTNLLENGSFERGWRDVLVPGTSTINQEPDGWTLTWLNPGDPLRSADWVGPDDEPLYLFAETIPECCHKLNYQLPPDQQFGGVDAVVLEGEHVFKVFSSVRAFGVRLMQVVNGLEPGRRVVFEVPARVHHHGDGSPGAAVWRIGIDHADGPWLTFHEDFNDREYLTFGMDATVADDGVMLVCIDLESRALAGIDFFIDNVRLRYLDDDPLPIPEPEPDPCDGWTVGREQYERTYVLMPPGCDDQWPMAAMAATWNDERFTVGGSADDAGIGPEARRVIAVNDTLWHDGGLGWWFELHYPGVEYVPLYADSPSDLEDALIDYIHGGVVPDPEPEPPEPEPEPPDPDWIPRAFVPTGTLLGFHAAGDGGQTGDVFAPLTPIGAQPPTAKVIVSLGAARDIKAIDPSVVTIGRIIDWPGLGNVEGFDYNGDAYGQAVRRMWIIAEAFGPHWQYYDYIEIINEIKPPNAQAHVVLAEFFKHCMQMIEGWGWSSRIALFSHSTGTPEPADWDAIADTGVFEMAAAGGHAISLHEYNINSGGGHLYRYRDLYERIILPKQLNIPLYITEYNVDVADAGNADLMFANWTTYDAEVSRDPYVAGVHIYSTGEVYSDYLDTIYSLWDRYRAHAIAVKDRVNG